MNAQRLLKLIFGILVVFVSCSHADNTMKSSDLSWPLVLLVSVISTLCLYASFFIVMKCMTRNDPEERPARLQTEEEYRSAMRQRQFERIGTGLYPQDF